MRVIAGRYRGRKLAIPRGEVRPTTDRLRESLFNFLGNSVAGCIWAEAFAGSGAVAIEALSRGAEFALLNDREPSAVSLLTRNLRLCGIETGFQISQKDAFVFLRELEQPIDFLFLDPPYAFKRYSKLLAKVTQTVSFRGTEIVIIEIFKKTQVDFLDGWRLRRTLKAGDSHLLVLQKESAAAESA